MIMTNINSHNPQRLRRRKEAAQYVRDRWGIPLSQQTLAKLAVIGGGPPYRLAGRFPLYEGSDLDAYALAKLGPKQWSTSDVGAASAPIADAASPTPVDEIHALSPGRELMSELLEGGRDEGDLDNKPHTEASPNDLPNLPDFLRRSPESTAASPPDTVDREVVADEIRRPPPRSQPSFALGRRIAA
jgi:hypothetical protein